MKAGAWFRRGSFAHRLSCAATILVAVRQKRHSSNLLKFPEQLYLQRAAIEPAKVLVSACLMGRSVRYNGSAKALAHPMLERLAVEGRLVAICPELSAGFSVPRPAAKIADGRDGDAVLAGTAKVIEATGGDITSLYVAGAHAALKLAVENGCRFALLIDGSP